MATVKNGDVVNGTRVWGNTEERNCSLCGKPFYGLGNNPEPLKNFEARCCDPCNWEKVIPSRLAGMRSAIRRNREGLAKQKGESDAIND